MKTAPQDYAIVVSSGSGNALTQSEETGGSQLDFVSIKAPSESAVFDLNIYDKDDYPIQTEDDVVGSGAITLRKISALQLKIQIRNATVDGTYNVRLYTRY